ncbi:MAG TPA: HD domain-containing protein [Tenuifilaceae bacterium]|nr:HD domain-containing protein [Tenuifilaceae bacterium]
MEEMQQYLKHKVFSVVSRVAEVEEVRVYVIGGYVRDIFLNRTSKDIDIVVVGSGIDFAQRVARLMPGARMAYFKNFGTAQLKVDDLEVEFVGARKESYRLDSRKPIVEDGTLDDDLQRRDFTINTLALSLNKDTFGQLVDPFNGLKDIKNRIIRTPLDPLTTFSDDPLRIMRAIRFATQLNFSIEPETLNAMLSMHERLEIVSMERKVDEVNKLMKAQRPSVGFLLMEQTGILEQLFPELAALKGVETINGISHKDNFLHTLQVLDNVAAKSDNLWLRWAALLHDVAKPKTKKYIEGQGWTFYGHDYMGSRMVSGIFRRLKLPMNERMRYVEKLVQMHLRPINLSQEEVTDSAVRRLLFEAGDDIDDLMTLCEADITSKNDSTVRRHLANFRLVREKLKIIEEKDAIRNFQPPISGNIIMETFGIEPCHEVGVIKEAIKNAILDGKIGNNFNEAYRLMLEKGMELGLKPRNERENCET